MRASWNITTAIFIGAICAGTFGCNTDAEPSPDLRGGQPSGSDASPAKVTQPAAVPVPSTGAIRSALDAGRFEIALSKAKAYLLANPDDPEGLFLAGQCLLAVRKTTEAMQTLKLIPVDDPQFGLPAWGQVADWQLQSGMPQDAEQSFRNLIETHGDIALAHSRLALLLNSQGRRYESLPHLMTLARSQDITRRELGALVTISDQCRVAKVPGTTGTDAQLVIGDLRRARQLGMTGEWEKSVELCERLREQFPDSPSIAAFLGIGYISLQRVDKLAGWHESLPKGIQSQPEYWSTMCRWMSLRGQHDVAIRCACESLTRDPTNHVVYETLAKSLRAVGLIENAAEAIDRYSQLSEVRSRYQRTLTGEAPAADLVDVGKRLLELKRPWESLGWLTVASKIDRNNQQVGALREQLSRFTPQESDRDWILCGLQPDKYPLPENVTASLERSTQDAASTPRVIALTDVAGKVGFDFRYDSGNKQTDGSYLLHETMGGGIGVIDYDHDGWPDLYLSQGGGKAFANDSLPNRLFRNLGGERFDEVGNDAGVDDSLYGMGVTAADFNQDGFLDLVVANIGPNRLYRNNGDGSFTEVRLPQWEDRDRWTSSVACGDLDGDAIPDLVECNYIDDPQAMQTRCTQTEQHCAPAAFRPATDRVLKGQADGTYTDWPEAAGLQSSASYSLGVIIADIDQQHGNELFIANDTEPNAYWVSTPEPDSSLGSYRLREEARLRGCATGPLGELFGCMGIATGDFDQNGTFDLYVTNYYNEASNLYLQQNSGLFVDSAAMYDAATTSRFAVGFGTQAADLDRDGWLDLGVLNGHAVDRRSKGEPLQMKPQLFRGSAGNFALLDPQDAFWSTPLLGRTLAMLDWNRDGRVDLVANHLDAPAALLQNASSTGHWIRFQLIGTTSERDAIGSRVTITCDDRSWNQWVTAGDGYFCTNEPWIDFGIDRHTEIDRVTIRWPSGATQQLTGLAADQVYTVIENESGAFRQ